MKSIENSQSSSETNCLIPEDISQKCLTNRKTIVWLKKIRSVNNLAKLQKGYKIVKYEKKTKIRRSDQLNFKIFLKKGILKVNRTIGYLTDISY